MEEDWRGLPITGAGPSTAAAVGDFQIAFQRFTDEANAIVEVGGTATDCLVVQTYAAALVLYSQVSSQIDEQARPLLERAAGLVPGATERERLLYAAVEAWSRSDFLAALDAFEALLGRWPEDVTAWRSWPSSCCSSGPIFPGIWHSWKRAPAGRRRPAQLRGDARLRPRVAPLSSNGASGWPPGPWRWTSTPRGPTTRCAYLFLHDRSGRPKGVATIGRLAASVDRARPGHPHPQRLAPGAARPGERRRRQCLADLRRPYRLVRSGLGLRPQRRDLVPVATRSHGRAGRC